MSIGVGGRFGEHSRRDPVVAVGEKGGVAFVCEMRSGGEGSYSLSPALLTLLPDSYSLSPAPASLDRKSTRLNSSH